MTISSSPPPIEVRFRAREARGDNRVYRREIQVGRGEECDVQVEAGRVSRVHVELRVEDGRWWIVDADSTNGTYREGEAIDRIPVEGREEVRLGREGPALVCVETAPESEVSNEEPTRSTSDGTATPPRSPSPHASASMDRSVTQYVRRYFEGEVESDAGAHTRMIQKAYRRVQARQRRTYLGVLAGVLALCILLGGYAVYQHLRHQQLRDRAEEVFAGMKEQEVLIAQLKRAVEASGDASLKERLADLEEQRRRQEARYAGYVDELGVRRDLTAKEREIYRVARLFRESEFQIPAGFVRRVKEKIQNYWKGPARDGLVRAIQRAENNGYTAFIVEQLQDRGLPPELFYLALQESRFDVEAVGPKTRWGIAKGLWQFIPSTARTYGLQLGPRVDQRVFDPQDDRHDFKASTRAAAEYLQTIYSTRAQASGLLVVASYNWGEHRVVEKMEELPGPQKIPAAALEGIPEDPTSRNYWQFLTTYEHRMPAETKDYVLKVFAAAVIGQAPDLFGFSFENPLREHIERTNTPQRASEDTNDARRELGARAR